jgi:hypothetical protein
MQPLKSLNPRDKAAYNKIAIVKSRSKHAAIAAGETVH